jgi:outer membrane biosynthesis protein TonB
VPQLVRCRLRSAPSVSVPSPEASSLQPRASFIDIPVSTEPTPSAVPSQPVAGVTPPIRLRTIDADYPTAARAAQLEGNVLLQAVVGSDGKPDLQLSPVNRKS